MKPPTSMAALTCWPNLDQRHSVNFDGHLHPWRNAGEVGLSSLSTDSNVEHLYFTGACCPRLTMCFRSSPTPTRPTWRIIHRCGILLPIYAGSRASAAAITLGSGDDSLARAGRGHDQTGVSYLPWMVTNTGRRRYLTPL